MSPADRFARLPDLLADDSDLQRRGRWVTVDCRIDVGEQPFFLGLENGALAAFERGTRLMRSSAFTIRGRRGGLDAALAAHARPGLARPVRAHQARAASMEGDFRPLLQNLQFFKDLLALPRRLPEGT